MAVALETRNLKKMFKRPESEITVLDGVNLKVEESTFVALTGKSGCGKTTLLQLLGALDKPTEGEVLCFDRDLTHMGVIAKSRFRRDEIGFVFQSYQLLPELSSFENIVLAGRLGKRGMSQVRTRAAELLDLVHMSHRSKHRPAELSGGEQQRIAIARALMNEPRLILADEPTGNLDAANSNDIMATLKTLRDELGKTIVMVTHSRELAKHADRVLVLDKGKLRGN